MNPYWQFFVSLESALGATTNFVEFSNDNYETYSIEFARIILSAGSEIDVVSKVLCDTIQPGNNAGNINDYRLILHSNFRLLHDLEILIPRYNLRFKPWESWNRGSNPDWWRFYNDIKHERNNFYSQANLKNSILSVAGLFCLVLYLYKDELRANQLQPWTKLLTINPQWNSRIRTDLRPGYVLPEFQT